MCLGSLSTLRQLSTALIAEAGPPPAAFLQLKAKTKKGSDEEESLDKVMAEQEQLRKDYEVKVAEIGDRIKELEAREVRHRWMKLNVCLAAFFEMCRTIQLNFQNSMTLGKPYDFSTFRSTFWNFAKRY